MRLDQRPTRLQLEHGPRILGVGFASPRLSWWLPAGGVAQSGYEIEATVDGVKSTSGEVASDESVLRPWPFDPLASRSTVRWRVRVKSDGAWSDWSEPHKFETALLSAADWSASFIGAEEAASLAPRGERPAQYFQRTFSLDHSAAWARVYATAHGVYELHLDGERVGDLELTPGFTSYRTHLEFQTYDITDSLTPGEHTLVATVSDGWWRGAVGYTHQDRSFGAELALLAQLEFSSADGERVTIGTDGSWQVSAEGPIVAADLMEGERIDQRISFPPRSGWISARIIAEPDARLTISPAPPTRRVAEFRPVTAQRLDADRQVVDIGANINGWSRLRGSVLGPAGNRVRMRHGELLGHDGDVDTAHLASDDFFTKKMIDVGQVDEVISAGPGAADFEPRHATHGFQYVGVEGATDISSEDLTGVMVHSDMRRTGWFDCSDDRLNALHEATVLSFRDNVCEVPTDCPTRERAGWTGDWQIFVPTAAFLYDVAGFSQRWLRDLAADQWEDGRVSNYAPDPHSVPGRENSAAKYMTGSAGWGDAAIYVPLQIWQSYGDVDILDRQYESMQRWIDFALRRAADYRHPNRVAERPDPAPYEQYLWDIGFHWGEWCEPGADPGPILRGEADVAEVATAYLYRSLGEISEVASLVGKDLDAERYLSLAGDVRAAWQAEFIGKDGEIRRATQANLVRALAFGLVDQGQRERVSSDLVKAIRNAGTTVGTGFLATPFLLPVLADHGHLDVAFELLLQTQAPSWLHMIEAGATTIWENWEGLDQNGSGSLNHYSKGAVVSFLHQYIAGLRPIKGVPAYRRFEVKPVLGGGLRRAEARLHTPHGAISSSWRVEGESFALEVSVAPGTEVDVTLPDGSKATRGPGHHRFTSYAASIPAP